MTVHDLRIAARTDRVLAEARLTVAAERDPALDRALYAVRRADFTGRINGTAALALRRMSGYQYAKLVLSFLGVTDMDAVARSINARFGSI